MVKNTMIGVDLAKEVIKGLTIKIKRCAVFHELLECFFKQTFSSRDLSLTKYLISHQITKKL